MAGNSASTGRSVANKISAILLTFTNGETHSLSEIARLTGVPLSTAWRLANELLESGILERTDRGDYRAGVQLKVVGGSATPAPDLQERARRVMEDLAAATRTTARFGILDGLAVSSVERCWSPSFSAGQFRVATLPAHATAMGKALLAFASPNTLDEVIGQGLEQYTPFTLATPSRLRRSLAMTRLTGVAVARREFDLGTSAIAAPVFGGGGAVVAALELEIRNPLGDPRPLQPTLAVAARALSRELAAPHPAACGLGARCPQLRYGPRVDGRPALTRVGTAPS